MKSQFEVQTYVRNGFPVIVRGTIAPAEPDVGLMTQYFEDFDVRTPRGGDIDFLVLNENEYDALEARVWDALRRDEK